MDTTFIIEIVRAVWREIILWRFWVVAVFLLITFSLLGIGFYWPERYQTEATLYADNKNIIEPLLEGRAEVTETDHSRQAREIIYTRRILSQVAEKVGLLNQNSSDQAREAVINKLRANITIENVGREYFRVIYSDRDQEYSFSVLNAAIETFIADSSNQRRQESRSAYEFIDQQVEAYKRQLLVAEKQLKDFRAGNLDGDSQSVTRKIEQLRSEIEELKLSIDETEAKRRSIREQINNESEYLTAKGKLDEEVGRLEVLNNQLDSLRLVYQETYPDIVSLKQQISAQELVIESLRSGDRYASRLSQSESVENPLYEELRVRGSEIELDLNSLRKRKEAIERILEEEFKRAERVAENEAELSELVRDYDVTREIYEEMLGRKEKARLSMTLDVEGQGINFKIQEPPVYPIQPSGLRFVHFMLVAPILGFIVSLGLIIFYVLVDPRLRSVSMLESMMPDNVEILAEIPHINTTLSKRLIRTDMVVILVVCLLAAGLYIGITWLRLSGGI